MTSMYDADRAALKAMGNSDPDAVIENARRLGVERRKQQERDHAIVMAALRWMQRDMESGDCDMSGLNDILDTAHLDIDTLDPRELDRICEDMTFGN